MPDSITTICPECQTRYTLKPDMAGKRMQCRDSSCGIVFLVMPLEAAVAVPTPPPQPKPAIESELDWQEAPPPIREESTRHWTEPPPIRTNSESALPAYLRPSPTTHRKKHWILALTAFVIVMASWGMIAVIRNLAQAEERLAADADKAYVEGKFGDAAQKYRTLTEKYARGVRGSEYKFLSALADMRRQTANAPPEPDAAVSALTNFMNEHGAGAYLASRRGEVFAAAAKVLTDVIADGKDNLQSAKPDLSILDQRLQQAKLLTALVQRVAPPDADVASAQLKYEEFAKAVDLVRGTLAERAEILRLLSQPRPDLESARTAIRRANLHADPEIRTAWRQAEEVLRKSISYRHVGTPATDKKPEVTTERIILDTRGSPGQGPRVPAWADGLLYALEGRSGRLAWVDRVGVDANRLPLRLTAGADDDLWLVYSTEPLGLSARKSSDGTVVWFQPLESPMVGSPVLAGRRVVAALSGEQGRVLDIDAASGQLTGMFEIGQSLGGGVAGGASSDRLYVPAIGQQVYVLDFGGADVGLPPQCVATLNTDHPRGSLVGQPLAVPGPDGQPTLLLTVADGVGDAALWLVRLADTNATTPSIERVPTSGWSWFPPTADPERLAWVTDRGLMQLMGLRRPGALDPPVFPLLDHHIVVNPPVGLFQRPMIAHGNEAGLVVLSGGQLRQWQLGIDRQAGRQCKPGWSLADPIGAPLANAWLDDTGAIILTTRRTDLPVTLVTAVRPESGAIIWQRPLGLASEVVAKAVGTNLLLVDPRGGVTALPLMDGPPKTSRWYIGGKEIARPVPSILRAPWIDTHDDGITMVGSTATGLFVRKVNGDLTVSELKSELPSPLAGRPGFGPDALVLPLKNGQLYRLSLTDSNPRPVPGPTWRATGIGIEGEGGVTHWHGSEYLVTDGSRRLMRLNWSGATDFELATAAALERPRRLTPPPVIIPGTPPRAAVADAGGTLVLMRGPQMEVERVWRLGDDDRVITRGPAVLNNRIAVILNDLDLICLDPTNNKPVWTYTTPGDGFVGLPVPMGAGWAVADRNGSMTLLDAHTGQPVGPGLSLPGLVAAAGPMIPMGPDRLFVVLTDGSAQVISAEQLTK